MFDGIVNLVKDAVTAINVKRANKGKKPILNFLSNDPTYYDRLSQSQQQPDKTGLYIAAAGFLIVLIVVLFKKN